MGNATLNCFPHFEIRDWEKEEKKKKIKKRKRKREKRKMNTACQYRVRSRLFKIAI